MSSYIYHINAIDGCFLHVSPPCSAKPDLSLRTDMPLLGKWLIFLWKQNWDQISFLSCQATRMLKAKIVAHF